MYLNSNENDIDIPWPLRLILFAILLFFASVTVVAVTSLYDRFKLEQECEKTGGKMVYYPQQWVCQEPQPRVKLPW